MEDKIALSMQLENLDELEKLLSRALVQEKELRKTLSEVESVELGVKVQLDVKHISDEDILAAINASEETIRKHRSDLGIK